LNNKIVCVIFCVIIAIGLIFLTMHNQLAMKGEVKEQSVSEQPSEEGTELVQPPQQNQSVIIRSLGSKDVEVKLFVVNWTETEENETSYIFVTVAGYIRSISNASGPVGIEVGFHSTEYVGRPPMVGVVEGYSTSVFWYDITAGEELHIHEVLKLDKSPLISYDLTVLKYRLILSEFAADGSWGRIIGYEEWQSG
jgi:hypothetical protein